MVLPNSTWITKILVVLVLVTTTHVSATPIVNPLSAQGGPSTSTVSLIVSRGLPVYNPNAPKRGLAYNNPTTNIQHFDGDGTQVRWAYSWDSHMDTDFPSYLTFVPMLWSNDADHISRWTKEVSDALNRGSYNILAFNEPDDCGGGGSCISTTDAVTAWNKYIEPYSTHAYLGAPAVTNGASGMPWIKNFLAACTGCTVNFVPIHWYDSCTNTAYFQNYIKDAKAAIGARNLWITEFNCGGTAAQQVTFMETMFPWLDAQTYVSHYSWFAAIPSASEPLVDKSGNPTKIGNTYAYDAF